jgi:DNA polymerase
MNESLRLYYLKQLGIDVWEERQGNHNAVNVNDNKSGVISLETVEAKAANCQACILAKTRTQVVFGTGNVHAEWMIIGEAPGFYEDQQGKPFVGRAGQLLNAMLASVGKKREDVYIANVLKCRPPNNRDPLPDEVEQCTPFLKQQIESISPKVILALGRHAAQFLLNTDVPMGKLRGKSYEWGENNIPVFVSYHPAYLLRNPSEKLKAWMDWLLVKKRLK